MLIRRVEVRTIVTAFVVPAEDIVPSNAMLADDGTPILSDDGNYILVE
jgi:hypothetical protein